MIHGGSQADLVAMSARVDACLHVLAVIARHEEVSFFCSSIGFHVAGAKIGARR
jgi:hypothetical protein